MAGLLLTTVVRKRSDKAGLSCLSWVFGESLGRTFSERCRKVTSLQNREIQSGSLWSLSFHLAFSLIWEQALLDPNQSRRHGLQGAVFCDGTFQRCGRAEAD